MEGQQGRKRKEHPKRRKREALLEGKRKRERENNKKKIEKWRTVREGREY